MKTISSLLAVSLPLLCLQAGLTQADTFLHAVYSKCYFEATPEDTPMQMAMRVNDEKCIPGTCTKTTAAYQSCFKDEESGLKFVHKLYNDTPYVRIDHYFTDCESRYPEMHFVRADGSCIPLRIDATFGRMFGTFKLDAQSKKMTAKLYISDGCEIAPEETVTLAEEDFGTCMGIGNKLKVYRSISSGIKKVGPTPFVESFPSIKTDVDFPFGFFEFDGGMMRNWLPTES